MCVRWRSDHPTAATTLLQISVGGSASPGYGGDVRGDVRKRGRSFKRNFWTPTPERLSRGQAAAGEFGSEGVHSPWLTAQDSFCSGT